MVHFALPILYANVLQSLNASVNSVWVGRFLGEAALTATSNANVVMFLLIGLAFGIARAATIGNWRAARMVAPQAAGAASG
jgi:Na+-driven multidrug efflux pump